MSNTISKFEEVIDLIIADISDRSGLGNEWDNIDEDIQDDIKQEWVEILKENFNG